MNPGQAQLMSKQGQLMPSLEATMQLRLGVMNSFTTFEQMSISSSPASTSVMGGIQGKIFQFFAADDMTGLYPRARENPFVVGIKEFGKVVVRDLHRGERTPRS